MNMKQTAKDPLERLLGRTTITESGCMEYTGCVQSNGYARATVNRKAAGAHRHVYELMHGPIPKGIDICHKCDNRKCINPEHLFAGSRLDNMKDAAVKGRTASGFRLPHTVLKESDFPKIVEMAKAGMKYADIGKRFGICRQRASVIARTKGAGNGIS